MKRRTLDVLFSGGGLALAALLLVMGLVMTSNANFAKDYVKDQLGQQKITGPPDPLDTRVGNVGVGAGRPAGDRADNGARTRRGDDVTRAPGTRLVWPVITRPIGTVDDRIRLTP